ncbi:MAG: hypothetical protein GXZ15_00850 [Campylobacter sp.]|nr:hypothetical protein [Campylobacter sp.]
MKIFKSFLFFILVAFFAAITVGILYIDLQFDTVGLKEDSLTEYSQAIYLFMTAAIFFYISKKKANLKQACVLISAFFIVMLIRESDAYFDKISHGSWVYFALFVTFIAIFYSLKTAKFNGLSNQLYCYTQSPSYGLMLAGLITILVFSRLFGTGEIWHIVLKDHYLRIVKDIIQESLESFGYTLCFLSSLWFAKDKRNLN